MNSIAISIGWNCDPAIIGVEKGWRASRDDGYRTCPFDLMLSNYAGLIQCLRDDFACFTDRQYLKIINISEDALCNAGERLIFNTKYRFIFNHESPDQAGLYEKEEWEGGKMHFIENGFERFIERYERRIQNFRDYLSSGAHILFLTNQPNDDKSELERCLHEVYPDLKFTIKNVSKFRRSDPRIFLEIQRQMRGTAGGQRCPP